MKYLYRILCCSALLVMVYSCRKDKNDYSYSSLNELSVNAGATEFVVEQLAVLNINPLISESIGNGGPYTYDWSVYKQKDIGKDFVSEIRPANTAIKLSADKNLSEVISLPPGNYTIQYTITDTKTKVNTYNRYTLTVNGKYYEGWTITANNGGRAEISFIRMDNKVFRNVVLTPLKGAALRSYSAIIKNLQDVMVFTDQEIYRLSANDFSLTGKSADLFQTPFTPSDPFYTINLYNSDQYIINNGGVYATISANYGEVVGKYSERFTLAGSEYALFPYYMERQYYNTMFYDNKGKRFLQTQYNSRSLFTFPSDKDAPFDMSNIGKTMVNIDLGVGYEYYCIMKDNANYYLYLVNPRLASPAVKTQTILNSPDMAQAVAFATSELVRQVYYGAGNKVYVYDVLANSSRMVYQFPTGTNVSDLKMFTSKLWQQVEKEMFNKRLVVATYNGVEGEVYYLDLSPTGDILNNTYSNKFGGFGHIVQLNYRNPNQ